MELECYILDFTFLQSVHVDMDAVYLLLLVVALSKRAVVGRCCTLVEHSCSTELHGEIKTALIREFGLLSLPLFARITSSKSLEEQFGLLV